MSGVHKTEKPMAPQVAAALAAVMKKNSLAVPEFNPLGLSKGTGDVLKKDKVNSDILARIRAAFDKADKDGTGQLEQPEFVSAFVGILQTEDGSDAPALSKLFMRIDANSDGSVDWDEFSNYMLLESQGAASIRDLETTVSFDQPDDCGVREDLGHRHIITHIEHITMPNGADRYVTCGKDGVVKVWNSKNMQHLRAIHTGNSWVTCARMLPTTRKLAVASFSRAMKIYDLQTYELCGQIHEIDYAPMSMDCWTPPRRSDVEMVVFGDGGGFVRLYELRINPLEDKGSSDRYLDTPRWKFQHHTDWVTAVKYIPEMNAVVAASLDKTLSITDAEERVPLKTLQGHTKGATSVAWSPVYKVLASGGQDRKVMLWNPFSQKPLAQLAGHLASVTAVVINDNDNQIISLSADKHVKLWDIRNHKCIQTMTDREVYTQDEDTLLCATYDHVRKTLVTGHTRPKLWRQTISTAASSGHRQPVVRIIYNPQFEEAVSGDQGGNISVWYVPTGKLRFRFHNAHKGAQLTALNFDGARRRLLTGADNGEVKVWNFSSGACLCTLRPAAREEVTCVLGVRSSLLRHVLVGGWDRKVTFYEDLPDAKEVNPGRHIAAHKADILDMALQPGAEAGSVPVLVTVSDDGDACAWNVESGACRKRFLPQGHEQASPNERPTEAVRFLNGRLRNVFVTVGADRFLRAWDVSGTASTLPLLELFTAHKAGETVRGIAVSADNSRVVTGDSAGFVKVWDFSGFTGAAVSGWDAAEEVVHEVATWRAHRGVISSVDWVDAGALGTFVLTSSLDRTISLWAESGAMVGMFGAHMWLLDEPHSWRGTVPFPMEERDKFDMDISRQKPKARRGAARAPGSETGGRPQSPESSLLAGHVRYQAGAAGGVSHRTDRSMGGQSDFGSPVRGMGSALSRSRAGGPADSSPGLRPTNPSRNMSLAGNLLTSISRPCRPTVLGHSSSGAQYAPQQLPGSASMSPQREEAGPSGVGAGPATPTLARRQTLTATFVVPGEDDPAGATSTAARKPQDGAPLSRPGSSKGRPVSAVPDEIARVLKQEQELRLRRVDSIRRQEKPHEYEPGGRLAHLGSGRRRTNMSMGAITADGRPSNPGTANGGEDDDDDDESELAPESEESSKHDSDEDVPRALWLAEFELARKPKPQPGSTGPHGAAHREAGGHKPGYGVRANAGRKVI